MTIFVFNNIFQHKQAWIHSRVPRACEACNLFCIPAWCWALQLFSEGSFFKENLSRDNHYRFSSWDDTGALCIIFLIGAAILFYSLSILLCIYLGASCNWAKSAVWDKR